MGTFWPASPTALGPAAGGGRGPAGKGTGYYLATRLDAAGLERVYSRIPALCAEPAILNAGPAVERVVRVSAGHTYEFLINHSADEREVEVAPVAWSCCRRRRSRAG